MVFLISRNYRRADRIFYFNFFIDQFCLEYDKKYLYIIMPTISAKYKQYNYFKKIDYIAIF